MYSIPVILGTVRNERQSIKPARYVVDRLAEQEQVRPELLDLADYPFPHLDVRYRFQEHPSDLLQKFGRKLDEADALVIVSPEYNSGYPGVLKNALDYFLPEFKRKPIGLVTVSGGAFGGINCMQQLRQVCYGLGAFAVPVGLTVPRVKETFDDEGTLIDSAFGTKAERFIGELLWYTEAIAAQRRKQAE